MISDDEAAKLAKIVIDEYTSMHLEDAEMIEEKKNLAYKVIELIERQGWIPASEKPERYGEYQVELPGGRVTHSYYMTGFTLGWSLADVLRWKPLSLPQPPEQP